MQLTVRGPLHEFDEFDLALVGSIAQFGALGLVRLLPFRRPFPPRRGEAMAQYLEAGEPGQQRRAGGAEGVERLAARLARARDEAVERRAQAEPFQRRHVGVRHAIAFAQAGSGRRRVGHEVRREFGNGLDVDIERIEEEPAVRRIRTAVGRAVVEQNVQRIEPDAVGPELLGEPDQIGEIGEVADAPVAVRTDAVELHGEQPAAVEIAAESPLRRHDHRHLFGHAFGIGQRQPVIAQRQLGGPGDHGLACLALGRRFAVCGQFPLQRRRADGGQFRARMSERADHDRPVDEAVNPLFRQGVEDGLQGHGVGDPQLSKRINKFGLNALDPGLS